MRIGYRKKIGGVYVSGSTDTNKIGKIILMIFLSPFYLTYYIFVWPFVTLYRRSKKKNNQITASAGAEAAQYIRITNDCSKLVAETKNPETFFTRYDLLINSLSKLSEIENTVPLQGEKPSMALQRIVSLREEATNDFIDRYAKETRMKIYELSTTKGKANRAEAFKNTLNEYSDKMTSNNMQHVIDIYEQMQKYIK